MGGLGSWRAASIIAAFVSRSSSRWRVLLPLEWGYVFASPSSCDDVLAPQGILGRSEQMIGNYPLHP